jgi:flagellar biosynthesis protein FlhB
MADILQDYEHQTEIYTNPRHHALALRYFQDVGAFEREAASRRP